MSSQLCQTYKKYLHDHKYIPNSGNVITHTIIPCTETKGVKGGSFTILPDELSYFYSLYYPYVILAGNREYFTEKQNEIGPIAVDLDFRYSIDVTTRQHKLSHIFTIIHSYVDEFKQFYSFNPDTPISIYVFEKPHVNRAIDMSPPTTKDGIHIIFGINADRIVQSNIRDSMIRQLQADITDLPLTNDWSAVLDEGITKGSTNWQLYGSCKPNHDSYKLSFYFVARFNDTTNDFTIDQQPFDVENRFSELSVQYPNHPTFPFTDDYAKRHTELKSQKVKKVITSKITLLEPIVSPITPPSTTNISGINNVEMLDEAIKQLLLRTEDEYKIKEMHQLTMLLPEKYYQPGSHTINYQVAFALKNTDERLFLTWVKLRSKASDFDYSTIPALLTEWRGMTNSNKSGKSLTGASIMYWVKQDNPIGFDSVRRGTVDWFINKSIDTVTDYDLANVVFQEYKDKYICVGYDKRGDWYTFRNHRWDKDKKVELRAKLSTTIYDLYEAKHIALNRELSGADEARQPIIKTKLKNVSRIRMKLKTTSNKNNIMRECAELFYDPYFIRNMDANPNLLCFTNGVIDFKTNTFRDGMPSDCITKCTHIPYTSLSEIDQTAIDDVNDFMRKLYPIEDLRRYMFDHLASALIGENKNQTFNVYWGEGSNGKSLLTDLMSKVLGDYKGVVPITLVTDVRGKIGGTSDEVLKLKGIRYAVMQEPTKGVKLNEGIMKELTGGDPLQARGLFVESEVFDPQFTLVVCTNNMFDIESTDEGTWRRIRKCEHLAKFVDTVEECDPVNFRYLKDKGFKNKLPKMVPAFISMLVDIAFKTNGVVPDCKTVMDASAKYRNSQDYINQFINAEIRQTNDTADSIRKQETYQLFKEWYKQQGYFVKNTPKSTEVYDALTARYKSHFVNNKWVGLAYVVHDETV